MKRLILRGGLAVLVLLVLGGVVTVMYADSLVKSGIEHGGTQATGQPTTVQGASLGLFSGELTIEGVALENPPGFDGDFFRLGHGEVAVSLRSLLSDTIEVPLIKLEELGVTLLKKSGNSNYETILDHMKKQGGGKQPAPGAKGGKGFIIRRLEINRVTAAVDIEVLGQVKRMEVEVPQIVLADVGSDSDTGVLLDELTGMLIQAVLEAVVRDAGNLPRELLNDLGGSLAGLDKLGDVGYQVVGDVTTEVVDVAAEVIDQVAGQAGDLGKAAGEEIKKGLEKLNPLKKD